MTKEYIVDQNGRALAGDIDEFIDSLMSGGQLMFRAASDATGAGNDQEGVYGSEALVESCVCRSFLVVPEMGYFSGVLGPLYCAVQLPDSYFPLHWHSQPIYFFQAADSVNNQSVRHFSTHPDQPQRPGSTDSYQPLMWLSRPLFEKKLHVDDTGRFFMDQGTDIGNAVLAGKRHHVLIKNLYADVVGSNLTYDYWIGFDLDLVQYYPGQNTATAQTSDSVLANMQSPFGIDNCNEVSLFISSTGHVSFIIRIGHSTQTIKTSIQGNEVPLGYETRCHLTEGELLRRKEIIWFVEK
jgi:hypothetical protein